MYALLISRDPDEKALLSLALQRAGLAVTTANDLHRAIKSWFERPADLVLSALGGDPLTHTRLIRAETEVPIVMIVMQLDEDSHCQILEAGADLVIVRPFSSRLLIAQLRALLRRAGSVPLSSLPTRTVAGLTLDPVARTVRLGDQPVRRLTHLEFRLLHELMMHQGQILTTEAIVDRVWGYTEGDRELVRGLVSRLRAKIEPDPRQPRYVSTVPGVGYTFDPGQD
jgi:DNA-binding response OmpR family regulator